MALKDLKSDLSWYGTKPMANNFANDHHQGFKTEKGPGDPNSGFVGISGNSYNKPIAAIPYFTVDPSKYETDAPKPTVTAFDDSKINEQYDKFNIRLDSSPAFGGLGSPFVIRGIQKKNKQNRRYAPGFSFMRGGAAVAERILEDELRLAQWTLTPRGLAWNLKQFGLQMSNPNVQGPLGKANPASTTKLYDPASPFVNALTSPFGIHSDRHGAPIPTPLDKYGDIVKSDQPTDINRLSILRGELMSTAPPAPDVSNWLQDTFGTNNFFNTLFGFAGQEISTLTAPGGPQSLYGIGQTTIHRAENTILSTGQDRFGLGISKFGEDNTSGAYYGRQYTLGRRYAAKYAPTWHESYNAESDRNDESEGPRGSSLKLHTIDNRPDHGFESDLSTMFKIKDTTKQLMIGGARPNEATSRLGLGVTKFGEDDTIAGYFQRYYNSDKRYTGEPGSSPLGDDAERSLVNLHKQLYEAGDFTVTPGLLAHGTQILIGDALNIQNQDMISFPYNRMEQYASNLLGMGRPETNLSLTYNEDGLSFDFQAAADRDFGLGKLFEDTSRYTITSIDVQLGQHNQSIPGFTERDFASRQSGIGEPGSPPTKYFEDIQPADDAITLRSLQSIWNDAGGDQNLTAQALDKDKYPITGFEKQVAQHGNEVPSEGKSTTRRTKGQWEEGTSTKDDKYADEPITDDNHRGHGPEKKKLKDLADSGNRFARGEEDTSPGAYGDHVHTNYPSENAPDNATAIQKYKTLAYGDLPESSAVQRSAGITHTSQGSSTSYDDTRESTYGYPTAGAPKEPGERLPASQQESALVGPDKQSSTTFEGEDFVDLIFGVVKVNQSRPGTKIQFRAFIDSLTDSISPSWSEEQDQGRADAKIAYQTYARSVSIAFKVAAFTADEVEALYSKMQALALIAYPDYTGTHGFTGCYCAFTLGDLYKEEMFYFTGVTFDWDNEMPWSLADGKKVPLYCNVSVEMSHIGYHKPDRANGSVKVFDFAPRLT